jgi:hypothetical protein
LRFDEEEVEGGEATGVRISERSSPADVITGTIFDEGEGAEVKGS